MLTALINLDLNENKLEGPIPKEIGMLNATLGNLMLFKNNLDGLIPDEIGLLTKLQYMDLSANNFTGAGEGICKLESFQFGESCGHGQPGGVKPCCNLFSNPAWTNGRLCPACLNASPCKAPVNCTGSSPAGIVSP